MIVDKLDWKDLRYIWERREFFMLCIRFNKGFLENGIYIGSFKVWFSWN